jgi:hypothetical protein
MDEDTKYLIDVNQANLDRIIGFVGVMDAKAKFVLTLVLALTGYLVTQLSSFIDAHTRINMMPPWAATLMVLLDIAAAACLAFFIIAAITAIRAIRPLTTRHTGKTSPLFFDTIADTPHEEFKQHMKTLLPNELLDLLADQSYDNAKIVQQKTRAVQQSMKAFFIGLACFFAFSIGRTIIVGVFSTP